jgi:ABC-type molybdenum transport system ATPase subunit/photorepair protein PhrA
MQRDISNCRKEISILAEKGTGFDNGNVNRKKRMILKTIKWKIAQIRCLRKAPKNFTET